MKHTSSFVLGLVGSILGIIGSCIWILLGISFWGGFYLGMTGQMHVDILTDEALGFGFIIAMIQSALTIAFFIVGIVKSTPGSLEKNTRGSGIWLLVIGIVEIVINLTLFIPGILLIIAGSIAISKANKKKVEANQIEHTEDNEIIMEETKQSN